MPNGTTEANKQYPKKIVAQNAQGQPVEKMFRGIESDTPSTSRIPPPEIEKDGEVKLHKKTSDKVAIVGFTDSNKMAPYNDKTIEHWGCNELYNYVPRLDVLFEVHSREEFGENFGSNHGPKHVEWLKKSPIPVYMAREYKDIPQCIPMPWYKLLHMTKNSFYINNQISLMVAMAVFMEYKWIGLFGCEMAHHTELGTQRPSVEWWLGLAEGKGIEIFLPEGCSLLNTPFVYGLERGSKWTMMLQEYSRLYGARVNEFGNKASMLHNQHQQYIGALNAIDEVIRHRLL